MASPTSLLKGFEKTVATIKPDPKKRLAISDPDTRGLYLRVTPRGHKSYVIVARDNHGKQVWATIGDCAEIDLRDARQRAGEGVKRIRQGMEAFPIAEPDVTPETFRQVADNFIERHVRKQELRSAREIERIFKVYVFPAWGGLAFSSLRRRDVAALLDTVEDRRAGVDGDKGGPVMADRVLAALSKLFNWYQARDDEYVSPVVRGMRRTSGKERARDRILSDEEIRKLWKAATAQGQFGEVVKLLLLTAQRRAKVQLMQWSDVKGGVWTIPAEAREKGNPGTLKLPQMAQDVLSGLTRVKGNPFVIAGRGKGALAMSGKLKAAFDKEAGFTGWRLHDLRRTAKSLMARAGVRPDISERVLGHVIVGVEGVYDRHTYEDEKARALNALAGLVALILDPPTGNVVDLRKDDAA